MNDTVPNGVWTGKGDNNEWITAANWSDGGVPTEVAEFSSGSSVTDIMFPDGCNCAVQHRIQFLPDAPSLSFHFDFPVKENTPALTIGGDGVNNQSKAQQNFIVASSAHGYEYAQLVFCSGASAGDHHVQYVVGPTTPQDAGGGVIRFTDTSTAGSAQFVVRTGAGTPVDGPNESSTVGAEVSFGNRSSAATATFTIYGSTSLTDGDTFGNVVFHDTATAEHGTFTNKGGTVPGGDGGNTQFYDNSSSGDAKFINEGGTKYGQLSVVNKDGKIVPKVDNGGNPVMQGANGGDVAFDGTATGANGTFQNYPATVAHANGGVTSFNNNPPNSPLDNPTGANAGHGHYTNYGATGGALGGGGHTYFTAKHGSPSADHGTFTNMGSSIEGGSTAGHTVFSVTDGTDGKSTSYGDPKPSGKPGSVYFPTAANGTFINHPAETKEGAPGYTEFSVYPAWGSKTIVPLKQGDPNYNNVPTAGNGTFHNHCGKIKGAEGGVTKFYATSRAGSAKLIAYGGGPGEPGQVQFSDSSLGESAHVHLQDGGVLSLRYHNGPVTMQTLSVEQSGEITMALGVDSSTTSILDLQGDLILEDAVLTFSFYVEDGAYGHLTEGLPILKANNIDSLPPDQLKCEEVPGYEAEFRIQEGLLWVIFQKTSDTKPREYADDRGEK